MRIGDQDLSTISRCRGGCDLLEIGWCSKRQAQLQAKDDGTVPGWSVECDLGIPTVVVSVKCTLMESTRFQVLERKMKDYPFHSNPICEMSDPHP